MPCFLVAPIAYTYLFNNIFIISRATKGSKYKVWWVLTKGKLKTENKIQFKKMLPSRHSFTKQRIQGLKFRSPYEALSKDTGGGVCVWFFWLVFFFFFLSCTQENIVTKLGWSVFCSIKRNIIESAQLFKSSLRLTYDIFLNQDKIS